MSVIPTVYNQGTGLIGSTTGGAAIPSNIDDLIINDTLLVGGEATFNGAVTVNNTLSVTGAISFQDVTVEGTFILEGKTPTQLAFYTTGGELTGTADMTYSGGVTTMTNVTVTTALSFGALTKTDSNNYAVAFHDNNRICIAGSPNVLTYNPFSGTLNALKVTVGDDLIVGSDLQVTFGNVTLTNGDLTMSNGTLTANAVTAGDADITNNLDVTGRADLGTIVTIQGLNTVSANTSYPILVWDNGGTGKEINVDAANFYYDTTNNTLNVPNVSGNFTITAQTRTDPDDYPVLFYDLATNDICIDQGTAAFTYNPNSNTLSTRNVTVAVDLTTEKVTLDTGNISNHSTNVYMGFKAISNNGTDLSGIPYNIALWQDGHVRLIGRNNLRFYIYNDSGTTTQRLNINNDGANVEGTIRNGTLPINYVQTFTCRDDGTQAAYVAQDTLNGWGNGTGIDWRTTAAQGASPTIYQYGANISDNTVTPILRGAINFQSNNDKFFLTNNDYAGWWYVDIHLLWQNLKGVRLMPRIDLGKQLTPTSAIVTEPQVGQGAEYTRNDIGELSTLSISGPIYMASTDNRFGIRTYLVDPSTQSNPDISVPPNWNDQTLEFRGLGLTISCKYLGLANNAGETINTL